MINKDDPRLTAYVLGELNVEERAIVENAIQQSPDLAQCVDEIRECVDLLGREFKQEEHVGLSADQKSVIAAVASESPPVERKMFRCTSELRAAILGLGGGGCVLVVVCFAFGLSSLR